MRAAASLRAYLLAAATPRGGKGLPPGFPRSRYGSDVVNQRPGTYVRQEREGRSSVKAPPSGPRIGLTPSLDEGECPRSPSRASGDLGHSACGHVHSAAGGARRRVGGSHCVDRAPESHARWICGQSIASSPFRTTPKPPGRRRGRQQRHRLILAGRDAAGGSELGKRHKHAAASHSPTDRCRSARGGKGFPPGFLGTAMRPRCDQRWIGSARPPRRRSKQMGPISQVTER
jgi:hypothetical protein